LWQNKTGDRWDRKIKYSLKEYRELKAKIDELRDRLGRGAIEIEKVAYVLGKREVDLANQAQELTDADDKLPSKKKDSGKPKTSLTNPKRTIPPAEHRTRMRSQSNQRKGKRQRLRQLPSG
jgi:chromosome segregation ATPase